MPLKLLTSRICVSTLSLQVILYEVSFSRECEPTLAQKSVYIWTSPASPFQDKLLNELEHRQSNVVLAVGKKCIAWQNGGTSIFSEFHSKSVLGSSNVCFGWLQEGTIEGKVTVIEKPQSI